MTIAFTGHRTINGIYAPNPVWEKVYITVTRVISTMYHKYNHIDFISGGALGMDQIAAVSVLNLIRTGVPIRLILALPFEGFESKWISDSKKAFNLMIEAADEVHYVCDPGYAPWKMMKRNEWMVDRAKTVVALYLPDKPGGTLNCINYAMKQKRSLITIHPITQVVGGIVFNYESNEYKEVPI